MFSHVMLGAKNLQESKKFYDAVLGALGYSPGTEDGKGRCFYMTEAGVFAISEPINGDPASFGNGSTLGFSAKSPAEADAWHAAGVANGGTTCEDPPGVRTTNHGDTYLAYLRDPTGNKICVVHSMR